MRTACTAILALALLSCGDPAAPSDLAIVLTVGPTQLVRTDSVEITLQITNRSSRIIDATDPSSYGMCQHAFQVYASSNREVAVPTFLCAAVVGPLPLELAPGESVTVIDYWKPGDSTLEGQPIPAGTYRVVGLYDAEQKRMFSGGANVFLLP
jgi:hypothetical protein